MSFFEDLIDRADRLLGIVYGRNDDGDEEALRTVTASAVNLVVDVNMIGIEVD